jgi:hypothetical protein
MSNPARTRVAVAMIVVVLFGGWQATQEPMAAAVAGSADMSWQRDLDAFAAYLHVDQAEAERRAQLEEEARALEGHLRQTYPLTFGGEWIDEGNDFGLTVAFTQPTSFDWGDAALISRTTTMVVSRSVRDLEQSANAAAVTVDRAGIPADVSVDIRNNRVVVAVQDADASAIIAARSLPSDTSILPVEALSAASSDIYGGEPGGGCTTGFGIIKAGTGQRGIASAGHCPNSISIGSVVLTMQQEVRDVYDTQWMLPSPGATVRNWVQDSFTPTARSITSRVFRVNQTVGSTVCHFGGSTGYGCGQITTNTLAPTSCISHAKPIYVQVHNANGQDLSTGGDSGGPWFWLQQAWGLMNCYAGNQIDGIYTPEDELEISLNITVMTAP